ncbi:transmembrane emp24 domain-containing protein 6-like [Lytechinus pictus]|uniref:transmembrane emp24 domain-containing protein 6-like n=1 Tax=Lytechinus pictus TaxID=7653 RepID=UPI00240D72D7|nr:transmembrane emp24 domain-containing protein 6-like [Lytechinus pictus]
MFQSWRLSTLSSAFLYISSTILLLLSTCFHDVGAVYEPAFETRPWADFMTTILLMPGGQECFYQDAKVGNNLNFEYQLTSKDSKPSLNALVKGPRGIVLYDNRVSNMGIFHHTTEYKGAYQFCIENNYKKYYVKYVKIYLSITDKERLENYYKLEDDLQETYGNLSQTLQKLTMSIRVMRRYQQWSGIRETRDRELLEANQSYVSTWSSLQCLVVVGAAMIQVYFLRSFFHTAKLTPTQKPRC